MHATTAGQLHRRLVAVIAGVEHDGFIARANQRLHRTEDRLGGARHDGHFAFGADGTSIKPRNLERHLLAQARQAGHRRVLVMPGRQMAHGGIQQRLRAGKIGEALG